MSDFQEDKEARVDEALAAKAAEMVASFLLGNGIKDRTQANHIAELIGVTAASVHRRLNGQVDWRLSELGRVAQSHGAELVLSFEAGPAASASPPLRGEFRVGEQVLPCRFRLGDAATKHSALVAAQLDAQWVVCANGELPAGAGAARHVETVDIYCPSARPRVAVLDDDPNTADAIRDSFVAMGFDALSFYDADELRTASAQQSFDAYILDWRLRQGETSVALCRQLRDADPSALLVLLSGQLMSDTQEASFFSAVKALGVPCYEKPVRPKILISAVECHVARLRHGAAPVPAVA